MKTPADGGEPPGQVPARKRRRRRRKKARRGADASGNAAANPPPREDRQILDADAGAPAKTDRDAKSRRRKPRTSPGNAPALEASAGEQPAQGRSGANGDGRNAGGKRRRRSARRWKGRSGRHPGPADAAEGLAGDAMRHLRSPVTPPEPPSFDAARLKDRPERRRDGRQPRFNGATHGGSARPAFAALDLGTNNCRLLVAVPQRQGRFRVVDAFSRIVRLGEGLTANGRLGEAAMERALEALSVCAAKLRNHRIVGIRMIATEACRQAENGAQFLAEVKRRTGLALEVVDRETEARLAAEGCGTLMDRRAPSAVLFDIGGGSSELVLVDRGSDTNRQLSRQIAGWTSLPLGVVTLSERHGGRRVSRAVFDDMIAEVLEHLHRFEARSRLDDVWHDGHSHLLGTSGTVTTIAGVHLKLPRYDRRKVDGIWLADQEIDRVIDELLDMDYETRARNPCIGRERADLVLAGCAILQAIRREWPSPRLRVADRGLREGILSELMREAGVWGATDADRRGGKVPR